MQVDSQTQDCLERGSRELPRTNADIRDIYNKRSSSAAFRLIRVIRVSGMIVAIRSSALLYGRDAVIDFPLPLTW